MVGVLGKQHFAELDGKIGVYRCECVFSSCSRGLLLISCCGFVLFFLENFLGVGHVVPVTCLVKENASSTLPTYIYPAATKSNFFSRAVCKISN